VEERRKKKKKRKKGVCVSVKTERKKKRGKGDARFLYNIFNPGRKGVKKKEKGEKRGSKGIGFGDHLWPAEKQRGET